jgi:hypothetical protein
MDVFLFRCPVCGHEWHESMQDSDGYELCPYDCDWASRHFIHFYATSTLDF